MTSHACPAFTMLRSKTPKCAIMSSGRTTSWALLPTEVVRDVDLRPPAHLARQRRQAGQHLDLAAFGVALDAALQDSTAGYVMSLHQHGRRVLGRHHNWAHTALDGSEQWTLDVAMHVASVSKFITGVAMTRLLTDKGMSFDGRIAGYLPAYWSQGPGIPNTTFRELMTHTSGFTSDGCDLVSVKAQVAAGVTGAGPYAYANSNYSLCRILLAVINGNINIGVAFPADPGLNDPVWDLATIKAYRQYATRHIFEPSASKARFDRLPADALAYPFPLTGNGWNSGDLQGVCGAAGWHISVTDLLKVMGTFRRSDAIVSKDVAQLALDSLFGIDWKISTPIDKRFALHEEWLLGGRGGAAWNRPKSTSCRRTWRWSSWRIPPSVLRETCLVPSCRTRTSATLSKLGFVPRALPFRPGR